MQAHTSSRPFFVKKSSETIRTRELEKKSCRSADQVNLQTDSGTVKRLLEQEHESTEFPGGVQHLHDAPKKGVKPTTTGKGEVLKKGAQALGSLSYKSVKTIQEVTIKTAPES